ncbi:MAG: hypothetical protein AAF610_14735 [Pseudomonadota bacterium]
MRMDVRFLVTRDVEDLPDDGVIVMVDGTVPSWTPRRQDAHWDHHRPGGAMVQMDEMPPIADDTALIDSLVTGGPVTIVTPLLDADACVAAVWLFLTGRDLRAGPQRAGDILRAVAFDCDHLGVPEELSDLGSLATGIVASLKVVSQKRRRAGRSQSASDCFEHAVTWLLAAATGQSPWPGQHGEACEYWAGHEKAVGALIRESRVSIVNGACIVDVRTLDTFVDARAVNRAADAVYATAQEGACEAKPEMEKIVLTVRDMPLSKHVEHPGFRFTLGQRCRPLDPSTVDFTHRGVWQALSEAEATRSSVSVDAVRAAWNRPTIEKHLGISVWGGRGLVGGSGWTSPSRLLPNEVLDVVSTHLANTSDRNSEMTLCETVSG